MHLARFWPTYMEMISDWINDPEQKKRSYYRKAIAGDYDQEIIKMSGVNRIKAVIIRT